VGKVQIEQGGVSYNCCNTVLSSCCSLWQIFRISTARYAEGLWRMRRHGSV